MSHHNNESTTISTYDHDDEKSINAAEKNTINQNNDVDIGIIEINPGVYHITNPVKYRKYLLSLDDTTEKTNNNKE